MVLLAFSYSRMLSGSMTRSCFLTVRVSLAVLSAISSGTTLAGELPQVASMTNAREAIATTRLEEPLMSTVPTLPDEDTDLAKALNAYGAQAGKENLDVFDKFLSKNPRSGWRVSLLVNLGLLDYHFGYFSRALSTFQMAWEEGRDNTNPKIKVLVDRAAGEELRMHARLGHALMIEALIADIGPRHLTGPATEALDGAKQGLWMMRNNPGVAYLCGPTALKSLLLAEGRLPQQMRFLDDVRSGEQGVSLTEVAALATKAGLDYRLVYRNAAQPVPVPSIIHWKLSHFAAITEVRGTRYHIVDPTFGNDLWLSKDVIDVEGSGYFLVPANLPAIPWKVILQAQAAAIRGM